MQSFFAWIRTNTTAGLQHNNTVIKNVFYFVVLKQRKHVFKKTFVLKQSHISSWYLSHLNSRKMCTQFIHSPSLTTHANW